MSFITSKKYAKAMRRLHSQAYELLDHARSLGFEARLLKGEGCNMAALVEHMAEQLEGYGKALRKTSALNMPHDSAR